MTGNQKKKLKNLMEIFFRREKNHQINSQKGEGVLPICPREE